MAAAGELPRKLGLVDSTGVVVGTMIGAGIFLVPNLVARHLPSAGLILAVWIFSGVLSFFGALAYAELGAMTPATGGQYVYLRESFGPLAAFLCGWTFFLVVMSGAIAWLAVSFSIYLGYFLPLTPSLSKLVSVALIAVITTVNYRGVKAGATLQNTFTLLKVVGLVILITAAFAGGSPSIARPSPSTAFQVTGFGAAMVACLLTYDGWVSLSFVAGEVKNPQRNLPLALALGLGIAMGVYLLANAAYLRMLSPVEIAAAERVGSIVAERAIGPIGAALVTATILVSTIGSANGWMLSAPRIYFAQACDGLFFRRFARVHAQFQTPSFSIAVQGVWAAILVASGSYEALASFAMFAAWIFYGLTALGVLVLRRRYPDRPRPYKMWGYPVTPLAFAAVALGFVINTMITTPAPALAGLALILAGVPVYRLWTSF